MPTFNSCTKCVSSPGRIDDRTPNCHLFSWAWINGLPLQLKVALSCKLCGSSMCFSYICDIISMGVSTTRHGQTSGRLVQELNVCTVVFGGMGKKRYSNSQRRCAVFIYLRCSLRFPKDRIEKNRHSRLSESYFLQEKPSTTL